MSELSPRLNLPFIQPAQAQKHVTHNEAIELLDVVVQLRLEDIDVNDPPLSPAEGQTWVVGSSPTAAWVNDAGRIATWSNNGWLFLDPADGWSAWVESQQSMFVRVAGTWAPLVAEADLQNVLGVGINSTSDVSRPLTVAGDSSLFNHLGDGHQLTINKSTSTDFASVLFQTGFSGRAEVGLTGSDQLVIKTSTDGSNWTDNLAIFDDRIEISDVLQIKPSATPASASAGDVYFDSTSSKLRCYDGSTWNDLF